MSLGGTGCPICDRVLPFALSFFPTAVVIAIGLTVVFGGFVLPELTTMLPDSAVTAVYAAIALYVGWGERDAR